MDFFLTVFLLSKNVRDTGQQLYMLQGILAGNLNLVSIMLLCLSHFVCVLKQLCEIGRQVESPHGLLSNSEMSLEVTTTETSAVTSM